MSPEWLRKPSMRRNSSKSVKTTAASDAGSTNGSLRSVKPSDLVFSSTERVPNSRKLSGSVSTMSSLNTKSSQSSLRTNQAASSSMVSSSSRLSLEPMTITDEDHVASPISASAEADDSSEDEFQEALETPMQNVSTPSATSRERPILDEASPNTPQPGPAAVDAAPSIKVSNLPAKTLTLKDVETSYEALLSDAKEVRGVLNLFLNSRMKEAESLVAPKATTHLYHSLAFVVIQFIKSLMTFEPDDLNNAIEGCKNCLTLCNLLRKQLGTTETLSRWVKGAPGAATISSMTAVERHAELAYAECLLIKAVIGIIYSGSFLSFIGEALNMRAAHATYRSLYQWVNEMESVGKHDKIDDDLRSGILMGNGMISLMLSLLPSKALKIMDIFGYSGDRELGLRLLQTPGGWHSEKAPESNNTGLRRPMCDGLLLVYYLIVSSYLPVGAVDMPLAGRILQYSLEQYPVGSFWLMFAGREKTLQTEGEQAIEMYKKSIESQTEYRQLHHICVRLGFFKLDYSFSNQLCDEQHWESSLTRLALGDYKEAHSTFETLRLESNWSKALWTYASAATLYESNTTPTSGPNEAVIQKATELMSTVPSMLKRVAGKTLPLEKYVARKSRKFLSQKRLMHPGLELGYVLNVLGQAPLFRLRDAHLASIDRSLAMLEAIPESERAIWETGSWYDDFCLLHLLRGVCCRWMAYPDVHAHQRPQGPVLSRDEYVRDAIKSFDLVFEHGPKIELDHFIIWFSHYECGRILDLNGQHSQARAQYEKVVYGRGMNMSTKKGDGKVSLQNAAVLRATTALDLLPPA